MSISQSLELSQAETRIVNQAIFEKLGSHDPMLIKQAVDSINEFTRTTMREDGFTGSIIPPLPVSNDELDRQVSTDQPVKVIDMEPGSPAAITVPFATLPMSIYIRGPRYPVTMSRIMTPRFTKDVDELRTWHMDIRTVLSDNAIKDMLAEEDGRFIQAVNSALIAAGSTVLSSGTVQWEQIGGGITRDGLHDMLKTMPSTPSHLEVHTLLCNTLTIKDVQKFGRTEMGGDLAQDIIRNGWSEQTFLGCKFIITIKTDIVPTQTFFGFADPKFIGKFLELEPVTMAVKREYFMLEFFSYCTQGLTIGNLSGLTRHDFV